MEKFFIIEKYIWKNGSNFSWMIRRKDNKLFNGDTKKYFYPGNWKGLSAAIKEARFLEDCEQKKLQS